MYMVEKDRRQHIRIHNEIDELSQPKHTYTCRKCGNKAIVEGLARLVITIKYFIEIVIYFVVS
jgi:hypothetical protein